MNAYVLEHWKAVLAAVFAAICLVTVVRYKSEITSLKKELKAVQGELAAKDAQLDLLAKSHNEEVLKLEKAEEELKQVSAEQKVKIVTVEKQVIPKECASAIQFAIDKKGDLAW